MGVERIDQAFKQKKQPLMVPYVMGYHPNLALSQEAINAFPDVGADLIELGMPFTDPVADGPTIEQAAQVALKEGATMMGILQMVCDFRKEHPDVPLILMGYYNPIYHMGVETFTKEAADAGVDGLLIVDVPPEEDDRLFQATQASGLAFIRLVTPTTDDARCQKICEHASGFIYVVSVAGITGTTTGQVDAIKAQCERFRKHTNLPLVIGFGIDSEAKAAALKEVADGVVVGSKIVKMLASEKRVEPASDFVRSIKEALK